MRETTSLAAAVILSVLLSFSGRVIESAGKRGSDRSQSLNLEWQILTKKNFSSEIRLHSHVLLMVAIPWSGEALSLMKQLGKLVANQPGKLGHLRLMVVHKNSQKMLADVLGATDEINLYFYHQSTSFKYNGRFAAEKILSSVNYFMSLKSEEVPLKPLYTQGEIKFFLKSTDKAILLIELCGWSSKLLHKKSIKNLTYAHMDYSENDEMFRSSLFAEVDERFPLDMKKNQKGLENGLGMADSHWAGEFSWANSTVLEEMEYETADINLSCTEKEFEQFKSFFSKFNVVAREFFLSPEMIRFGLISERSLLPYVGVSTMGAWLVMLQFNGCPSCSMTLKEGDDLRKILQEHHTPVRKLDVDRPNFEPTFPSNRPSVVLFIDRLSDSQVIREKSKLALDVLRKLEEQYHPSYWMNKGTNHGYPLSPAVQVVSESQGPVASISSGLHLTKDSLTPNLVKIKDNTAIVINKGQSILLDRTASYAQANAVYDALLDFINKRNLNRIKESKISLLAKENGFQLLSDDFEVQVIDSSPYYKENNQLSDMNKHTVTSLGSQNFELHHSPNEDSVNKNDDLLAAIEVSAADDATQPALGDSEYDIKKYLETDTRDKSNPNELASVQVREVKDAFGKYFSTLVNEDVKSCEQNDLGSLICHDAHSVLEEEVPSVGTCMEKDTVDAVGCSSSSRGGAEKLSLVDPVEGFSGYDGDQVEKDVISKPSEEHIQHQPFQCSFFFIDGGYRLLNSLTGGSNIPSLVLLDPVEQQHYVFSEDRDVDYYSMATFVEKFLNGSLSPYKPSASSILSSKEAPQPPFVNLDFHEVDAIPRVTTNTFCELVFGFNPCVTEKAIPTSQVKYLGAAWKTDVLVLFVSSWCGFCQRMELLVREVYRAFNNLKNILTCDSSVVNLVCFEDNRGDVVEYNLPSIFLMDCAQGDCSSFLKSVRRNELYPELLLYSAQNKSAIPYDGDMLVVSIIKFLVSQGRNSLYLSKYEGYLWKHSLNNSKKKAMPHDASPFLISKMNPYLDDSIVQNIGGNNQLPAESPAPNNLHNKAHYIVPGYILFATDKLQEAIPFDNSTILITLVNEGQALQGLILNKPVKWDIFENLDHDMEPIKQAPISYGGPVRAQGLPLVSLARKPTEGYTKVIHGVYFGNPMITSMVIGGIKSGDRSCNDYWFFLGYASWEWDQFFDELAEGAWHLSDGPTGSLNWPNS
ncbi:hypothetical protein M5K25_022147 [Dendrobium thyrsiflorum]|uniref:Thioredoxin domain-containing protein n=1 Tax=Dendrobium thyrsiflorum TaxID=117978 RepID=A0ABD0UBL2_DENTH